MKHKEWLNCVNNSSLLSITEGYEQRTIKQAVKYEGMKSIISGIIQDVCCNGEDITGRIGDKSGEIRFYLRKDWRIISEKPLNNSLAPILLDHSRQADAPIGMAVRFDEKSDKFNIDHVYIRMNGQGHLISYDNSQI